MKDCRSRARAQLLRVVGRERRSWLWEGRGADEKAARWAGRGSGAAGEGDALGEKLWSGLDGG